MEKENNMEEENKFEEQPEVDEGSSTTEQIEDKQEESEAERGVPIGKFKNVEDLYQAYNNLQSEFTRKCQRLAEIEKDKTAEQQAHNQFEEQFKAFLYENQDAFSYADEIRKRVDADENLKAQEKPFDKVWSEMLFEKLSSPNKAEEPMVQNFILNDEKLKNLVIQDYVKQLQGNKTPFVMSSNSGERVTKPATPNPDSFEQAKKIVLDMLS